MPRLIPRNELISNHPYLLDGWWLQIADKINVSRFKKPNSHVMIHPLNDKKKKFQSILSFPIDDVVHTLKTYVNKDQHIIISCWHESFHSEVLKFTNEIFSRLLETKKFSREQLIIITGALPVKENYDQYVRLCQINDWPIFPIIFHSGYENKLFNFIAKKREYSGHEKFDFKNFFPKEKKEKLFLILNGRVRSHRTYFLLHLARLNLVSKCLYSYLTEKEEILGNIERVSLDETYIEKILPALAYIDNIEAPKLLTLQTTDIQKDAFMIKDEDLKLFDDTYLSIIPETTFYKYEDLKQKNIHMGHLDGLFLTEKTFRAIACKHPFIILGRPGLLKALREFGYKTFSPWIDESYDEIENDYDRLDKIINMVDDLASKDNYFWNEFYQGTKDIVEHNYDVLYNNNKFPFNTSFYP